MRIHDPKKYYRILGVSKSASGGEIRSSFRKLAKLLHPDRNSDPSAPRLFQAVHEAYEVLGNAERRARYDGLPYAPGNRERPRRADGPIVCSSCGRVTAQPRYVVYYFVISALMTFHKPVQGIFCAACSKRKSLEASAISALAGWWGIFGPFDTVRTIIRNAKGGHQEQDYSDRLLWANAQAFLAAGKPELSYALASELRTSKTDNLAAAAARLIDSLKAQGVTDAPHLKSPWKFSLGVAFLHLILLLAVPATFIAFFPPESLITAITNPPTIASRMDQSECDEPPSNGQVLDDNTNWFIDANAMDVQNRSGRDAIVKIRNAASGKMLISFFVANNETAKFERIPDGTYRIQYALGSELDRYCAAFVSQFAAAEFSNPVTFVTRFEGIEINHQTRDYTLYPLRAGNNRPNAIRAGAFNAP
jgi:hypothetical protein